MGRLSGAPALLLELGHMERYKREGRASRGLQYVDELGASWLDFKLGARMLVKYPGLALVGREFWTWLFDAWEAQGSVFR